MLQEYRIMVATTFDKHGNALNSMEKPTRMHRIQTDATEVFGGYTTYAHKGAWQESPTTKPVIEAGFTLSIVTNAPHEVVYSFARRTGRTFYQASVTLILPGGNAEFLECY